MNIGEMTLEDAARKAAGNWRHFDSFAWHRSVDLSDAERFCIIYTHHRDSTLLDKSNHASIEMALMPFTNGENPDVVPEHHHHWAVGWVDGFSIRVFKRGRITRAFRTYHALAQRMADYPVLDEQDYCRREYEDTLSNLADAAWRLKTEFDLPDGWETTAYDWFAEHDSDAIENTDDRGGYPSHDQLERCFEALRFERTVAV